MATPRVRDEYGRVDVAGPVPSWRQSPRPVWVDADFQKYSILRGEGAAVTCLRRDPTPAERAMQCTGCYNRHRPSSVVCLGNMPHARSPMVAGTLYDLDTLQPAVIIRHMHETSARGRLTVVDMQLQH
jgi:hypothetical protein